MCKKKLQIAVAILVVLGAARASMAQCPVATGDQAVVERLDRLESQVAGLTSQMARADARLDRLERISTNLAMVSSKLVDRAAMGNQPTYTSVRYARPNNTVDPDEPISLVADRPDPPTASGTISQSESGRVEFRAYGNGAVRLPLLGGGLIAVGPDPSRWGGGSSPSASRASYDRIQPVARRVDWSR